MKRPWVFLIILCASLVSVDASAAPAKRQVKRHAKTTPDVIARTRWINDGVGERHVYDLTRARFGHDVIIDGVHFAGEFSDGGSFDLPQAEVTALRQWRSNFPDGTRFYLVPTTNPLWYDKKHGGHQPKIDAKNNAALRLDRGAWINDVLGYEADVYGPGMVYNQKGVFIIAFHDPPAPPPTAAGRDTVIVRETQMVFGDMLRLGPSGGVTYLHAGDHDFMAPMSGLWISKRRWTAYASYGRTFSDRDDRIFTAGVQRFMTRQLSLELGWIDARTLFPFTDEYTERAIGGTVGLGLNAGGQRWNINGRVGLGGFNVVDPSQAEDHWEFGFVTSAAGGFTF